MFYCQAAQCVIILKLEQVAKTGDKWSVIMSKYIRTLATFSGEVGILNYSIVSQSVKNYGLGFKLV